MGLGLGVLGNLRSHVGVRVLSQGTDSYLMGLIAQCIALVVQPWGVQGGWDVGFSLCPVPAYYTMSEYLNWKAEVQDSMPRDKSESRVESQGMSVEL